MSEDDYQGEFSVCQFFDNGEYEYVRRWVGPEEAVKAFAHYTTSLAVKMGKVERVIITDGGDFTNLEWQAGKGFTYDGVTYQPSPHSSLHPHVKEDE
jgi:hypothetical protein